MLKYCANSLKQYCSLRDYANNAVCFKINNEVEHDAVKDAGLIFTE